MFHLQIVSKNFYWEFPFGKGAFHLSQVPFEGAEGGLAASLDRERFGTGDKDEKSVNGTQISNWEVSTGKTGLPFQKFRLFQKISSGTNPKMVVFHLYPNWNFRNFLVNRSIQIKPRDLPRLDRAI